MIVSCKDCGGALRAVGTCFTCQPGKKGVRETCEPCGRSHLRGSRCRPEAVAVRDAEEDLADAEPADVSDDSLATYLALVS